MQEGDAYTKKVQLKGATSLVPELALEWWKKEAEEISEIKLELKVPVDVGLEKLKAVIRRKDECNKIVILSRSHGDKRGSQCVRPVSI